MERLSNTGRNVAFELMPTQLVAKLKCLRCLCFHGNNLLSLRRGPALWLPLRRRGRDAPVGVRY